jgi:hypothetical protein
MFLHESRFHGTPGSHHIAITAAILGHGDKKKSLQALYLTISDENLLAAIDMMKFDKGETDIRTKK